MKKLFTLVLLVVLATTSFAQKSTGFYVTPGISFTELKQTPPQKLYSGEAGYFGNVLGVAALAETNQDWNRTLIGVKAYVQLFTVANIKTKVFGAVKGDVEDLKSIPLEFEPGLAFFVPLTGPLGAKLTGSALLREGSWKAYPTAGFGLTYRLF